MPTTYLWQQRLLNSNKVDGGAVAAAHSFARDGSMDKLLQDVTACGRDVQRMVGIIRGRLNELPVEHRRAIALLLYRSTQGQGAVTQATESALGFV